MHIGEIYMKARGEVLGFGIIENFGRQRSSWSPLVEEWKVMVHHQLPKNGTLAPSKMYFRFLGWKEGEKKILNKKSKTDTYAVTHHLVGLKVGIFSALQMESSTCTP